MRSKARCVVAFASLLIATGFTQRPQLVWSDLYDHPSIQYRLNATSSLMDNAGNLYLINAPYQSVNYIQPGKLEEYTPKVIVEQYAPSGNLNWRLEWRHPQAMSHRLIGATLDTQGRVNLFVHVAISVWRSDLNRLARVQIAPNGAVEAIQEYPLPLIRATGFIHRSESGEVFVYTAQSGMTGPTTLWKFSALGVLLWQSTVNATLEVLAALPNGEVVAAGYLGTPRTRCVMKFGTNGDILWTTRTTDAPSTPAYYAIGVGANGRIYAVNSAGNVEVFSTDGTLIHTETNLRPPDYQLADAAVLADGILMLWIPRTSLFQVLLTRASLELTPEWQVAQLGSTSPSLFERRARFFLRGDGSVVVAVAPSFNPVIALSHVSAFGERLWQRNVSIPMERYVSNIAVLASAQDGTFFIGLPRNEVLHGTTFSVQGEPLYQTTTEFRGAPHDLVYQLSVDNAGNSVLTRYSLDPGYFTYDLSYSASGARRWNEPGLLFGFFDPSGNWLSAGWNWQNSTAARVIKRAPNGQLLWNRTYSNVGDFTAGVATSDGAFYLTAWGFELDYVHRFSADGTIQWTRRQNIGLFEPIADGAGGVFVPAFSGETTRYSADGSVLWAVGVPVRAATRGADDSLYTLGTAAWSPERVTWRITRINPNGVIGWQRDFETDSTITIPWIGATDPAVYVVINSQATNRLIVGCFAPATGALRWERVFELTTDQPQAALDAAGNLYLAFRPYGDDAPAVRTLKFAPDGEQLWRLDYAPRPNAPLQLMGLAVDPQNRMLLAGEVVSEAGDSDIFIAQFRQPLLGDANGDGCVNEADLLAVLFAFGSANLDADLNGDGVVDDADLVRVLFQFGAGC